MLELFECIGAWLLLKMQKLKEIIAYQNLLNI